jgi:ADP-ribosyl-[dinitrogen reductase] hydrolase
MPQRKPSDRYAGSLLALACGDALGAPAEFLPTEGLHARFGQLTEMVGGGHFQWEPGEWTDDTGMTLCVAKGILENPDDPVAAIGERFLTWQSTAKDVGGTIAAALGNAAAQRKERGGARSKPIDWAEASRTTEQARAGKAAGNGSLMRALPVALAYPDREAMLTVSARVSAMTHWDPQAELACAIHCLWVRNLLRGLPLAEAWGLALEEGHAVQGEGRRAADTPGPGPVPDLFWRRLETALERRASELQPHNGYAGYVLDCLEAVVWCCHQNDETDEALIRTVNLGGETDTMAAIGGGVMGIVNGLEGLRKEWLEVLYQRSEIERLGRQLSERRSQEVYARPGLPAFSTHRALPGLIVGRNPLTEMDVEQLLGDGIRLVIDLREEHEWATERHFGAEAVAAQQWCGLERFHVPVSDGDAPSREDLDRIWGILRNEALECGGDVYIHCRAGIERTGAAVVSYTARSEGVSYEQALRIVQGNGAPLSPLPHQADAVKRWLGEA